jgi:hypothetical protein
MTATGNKYWTGSNGKIWVNDSNWDEISSFSVKAEFEFEEVPNGMKTSQVLVGYKVSGSLKMRKTDSRALTLIADDYRNGIIPDVKIISKVLNKSTGETERIAYIGVTFDSLELANFEEKKIIEGELPFKAEDFKVLASV